MGSPSALPGHVYLAGAGPGAPDLLTLRALRLLETATVLLFDDLVSEEILTLANPAAEAISVGKRCGQPRITQPEIHALMVAYAQAGASVLRLKSGDPLIFGRAGEEIDALRAANIPFEIVPGITSAFAAAAALQTPLTSRTAASRLILATAHHTAEKHGLTPIWTGALPDEATLALYMPGRHLRALAEDLIASGVSPDTPVAAISRASTLRQHTHTATLATLHESNVGPSPVLLLIGHAIQILPEEHADANPSPHQNRPEPEVQPASHSNSLKELHPSNKEQPRMTASPPAPSPFTTEPGARPPDPIEIFRHWLADAAITEPNDPNAMALATCTPDGRPSLRMVLLKGLDERGFAFYTNGESRKGMELAANPHAAITFHWKTRRRQVRVEGPIAQLPAKDADRYFHSRSHGSQISAAASQQSRPVASREALEAAAQDLAARFPNEVPRPDHWRGYALQPTAIEFWQDGADRLHDRILYTAGPEGWTTTRLYP